MDAFKREDRVEEFQQRIAEGRIAGRAGSFEWDLRHRVVRWSDELCRIYGVSPKDFEGTVECYLARVHPGDLERTRRLVAEVFRQPHGFTYEHRIVLPDRRVRVLYLQADLISESRDQSFRLIGSCWDVTDRRKPDDSPACAVGLLQAVLEASVDGILVVDRLGKVVTSNDRFLSLWAIPRELASERRDRVLLDFVLPQLENPAAFLQRVHELYAHPEADSFEVVRFKDGRVFERHSRPHRIGAVIVGRVWAFRDVTLRENLLARQTLLADASRLLSSLDLENALTGIISVALPYLGQGCAIDLASENGPQRIAARSLSDAGRLPPCDAGFVDSVTSLRRHGDLQVMTVPLQATDPDTRKTRAVGAMRLVAQPERQYTRADIELAEDLAHRISLELEHERLITALRDALRTRDEFLSIAAHEIRGPLMSIRLAVDSLHRMDMTAPRHEQLLDLLAREDRRLARFVDDLVDLSRIRAGRLEMNVENDVDLQEIVRRVAERLEPDSTKSGSKMNLHLGAEPTRGQWDRFRLDQVVTNLLTNAIKFGCGNPIDVSLRGAADHVTLTVADHGIGIAPDLRERIFEPFERGVSVRHYGGLGLGLFIVRVIVSRLGGKVSVDSVEGHGTRFVVELPRSSYA